MLAGRLKMGDSSNADARLRGVARGSAPHVQSGTIKAYTVDAEQRSAILPSVPTAKEAGLPEFKVSAWVAYVLRVQSTNRSINMSRLYSRGAQCYLPVQCQTHQNQ